MGETADRSADELDEVRLARLSSACGVVLSAYGPAHVRSSVARAIERHGLGGVDELIAGVNANDRVRAGFRRLVLVPVSGLFRDPQQFDLIEHELLPEILARRSRPSVWSAGCADGAELYSVALLLERMGALEGSRLLGSDVREDALAAAAEGRVGSAVTRMPDPLRAAAIWEHRDLTAGPAPSGRFDIVLCRNLAIYLAPPTKDRLHAMLAGALRLRGGWLVLGRSETVRRPERFGLRQTAPHIFARESV